MKKLVSLVIVMALIMAFMVPTAMAAGSTGSITVKNTESGATYKFYRILDLTGQDTTSDGEFDAITYTFNDTWKPFFESEQYGKSYIVSESTGANASINDNGTIKYIKITGIDSFLNDAMEYAFSTVTNITADAITTGDGSDVTVSNLPYGYYMMIPVNSVGNGPIAIASINSTIPNAEFTVKSIKPSITKTDDAISADIGQKITYTITGAIPNVNGYPSFTYKVSDTMSSGLTFQKDVSVKINNVDVTNQFAIDYSTDNAFTASITLPITQNAGDSFVFTYTAIVNDNAVERNYELNTATLTYGYGSDTDFSTTTAISEEVYTSKIIINKHSGTDAADTTKKLADAQFVLMNSDGKFYKYTAATATVPAKVEWVELTGGPAANTTDKIADSHVTAISNAVTVGNITGKTTDENGAASFDGIADGTYYLVEFESPDGYNRLDTAVSVTVTGTNADTTTGKTENTADSTGNFDTAVNSTANVQNQSGTVLPSTGGMGTTIFYALGGLMFVGALVLLVTNKRMKAE